MKKARIIYLVVFAMVVGGFCLAFFTKNFIYIPIAFGISLVFAIISLLLYSKKSQGKIERQNEQAAQECIEEINNLQGDTRLDYTSYQVENVKEVWKQSSKADIIKGILFLLFFLGCIFGFVVCLSLGYMVWGFICFGLGMGEIFIAFICVKVSERRSLKLKKGHTYTKATATVLGCTMSSQSTSGSRRYTQITNTTYKVFLDNKRVAFSKEYYDVGDKVDVHIDTKNPKRIIIMGKHKDIFDLEENEF